RNMICDENTPEELIQCARHMVKATAGCEGWRPPIKEDDGAEHVAATVEVPFPRRRISEGYDVTWL
ncbi:MAG: hypothetical protein MJA84_14345, partial [Firmicutes bacterium]|nr:hypothetical protein [Bacillota bacterium]